MVACDPTGNNIDTSDIEVEIAIERFDRQLFDWTAVSFRKEAPAFREQNPGFYKHYFEDVIRIGQAEDSLLFSNIRLFASDPSIKELQESVQQDFADLSAVEHELKEAWARYLYFFPQAEVPKHIAFTGTLNANIMVTDREIGIGLDAYLGRDEEIYELAQVPLFQREHMIPERIAPDVIRGWMESEFVIENEQPRLIEIIIHEGRLLYALDVLFPALEDQYKMGYTAPQMEWAKTFEQNVWTFFIDNELLFNNKYETLSKYVSDGPFTTGFAKESPARMGTYIGWQIVRSYMNEHPEMTLTDLMALNDAQDILSNSKYKP